MNIPFDHTRAVQFDSCTLADNLRWEAHIFKNLLVDVGQGTRSWSWLFGTRLSGWFWHNLSLRNEEHVSVRELLFQLTGQARLNLVELFQQWHRHKDDDSFSASNDFNLHLIRQPASLLMGKVALPLWRR